MQLLGKLGTPVRRSANWYVEGEGPLSLLEQLHRATAVLPGGIARCSKGKLVLACLIVA